MDEDRRVLDKTQADQPANVPAAARSADLQLTQLRQQIDDLSGKLKTARNVQTLSVADAGEIAERDEEFRGDCVADRRAVGSGRR